MSANVLDAPSKSDPSDRTAQHHKFCTEFVDNLPPKFPGVHRSPDNKRKQVAFGDGAIVNPTSNEVKIVFPRHSWSCESDSAEQNFSRKYSQTSSSSQTTESQDSELFSRSSRNSESDSKDQIMLPTRKFPGIHPPSISKDSQRVVSWGTEVMIELESALNDLKSDVGENLRGPEFESERVLMNERYPESYGFLDVQPSNYGYKWNTDRYSQFSKNFVSDGLHSKDLIMPSRNRFPIPYRSDNNKRIPREYRHGRVLVEDDVRKIVNDILNELRPGRPERSISCNSSCSGCCSSCCYSSSSNFGCCTPRPSTPAVDIPKKRQKANFLVRVHGTSPSVESYQSSCSCAQCNRYQYSANQSSFASSATCTTTPFCSKCLPPFQNDSLDSKISLDSLKQPSIFSLDSLNSLTDPDSLEYAKTNISIDSLDSLDSCCNYDSLSDSKDSGFFSCSLPAVC